MTNPEIIYLEPECCSEEYSRQWSDRADCFDSCEEGVQPTKYIRADLCSEESLSAIKLLAQATEFQIGDHLIRKNDHTWLLFDEKRNLVLPQYRFDSLEEALGAVPNG